MFYYQASGVALHFKNCCIAFFKRMRIMSSGFLIIALILFNIALVHAVSEKRFALVIGNSNYTYASKLKNPKNDSGDIASTLTELKFDTNLLQNATKKQIQESIAIFLEQLRIHGGVGLFYYAGHGVQFQGDNYLIPVETNVGTEQEIQQQSFNIANLLNGLRKIKSATNIIILDACRDNPFKEIAELGTRSAVNDKNRSLVRVSIPKLDSGLSKLDAPSNTLIAFATAPGSVALDGKGRNSPYTAQLVESMQRTGLTIGEVFRQVRASVIAKSDGKQIPWESSSLVQDFYFKHRAFIPVGF